MKHAYGLDYWTDVETLYGKNNELLNNKRIQLFEDFNANIPNVKILRNIIQNPMPITIGQFNEWDNLREKLVKEYSNHLSYNDKKILDEIKSFAYIYHVNK